MALKTLLRDSFEGLEVIIEKSDSGRLFFGLQSDNPLVRECYSFDIADNAGCLIDLTRRNTYANKNGQDSYREVKIVVNPVRKIISYFSRTDNKLSHVRLEIFRAYQKVRKYYENIASDKKKSKLYPEVVEYLGKIASYHQEDFHRNYTADLR